METKNNPFIKNKMQNNLNNQPIPIINVSVLSNILPQNPFTGNNLRNDNLTANLTNYFTDYRDNLTRNNLSHNPTIYAGLRDGNNTITNFPFNNEAANLRPETNNSIKSFNPFLMSHNIDSNISASFSNVSTINIFQNQRKTSDTSSFKNNTYLETLQKEIKYYRCPISITDLKVDIDNIVEKYRFVCEEFICCICQCLIFNPEKCKLCDKFFCKVCIAQLEPKKCPFKCKFLKLEKPGRTMLNILSKIELYCKYCKKIVANEHYMKHLDECDMVDFKCSGCLFTSNKAEVSEHTVKCQEIEEQCNQCCISVKRRNTSNHLENYCEYSLIECNYCKDKFPRKHSNIHSKDACFVVISSKHSNEIENLKMKISFLEAENENLKNKINSK